MSKSNQFKYYANLITVLFIYMFAAAGGYQSAAVQRLCEAWPDVAQTTIMTVNTLPALVSIPMMIFVGNFVGTKISYRTAYLLGCSLVVVGGVLPFFYAPSWTFIMACRVIIGIGAGFFGMRAALLIKSCKPEDKVKFIGIGSALYSGGSMLWRPVVGLLVGISWRHGFLVNFVPLIFIVMNLLFFQEPEKELLAWPEHEDVPKGDILVKASSISAYASTGSCRWCAPGHLTR